jgi:L-ascorbate metabolism protein UlaG (beta-lactamase superfamily)
MFFQHIAMIMLISHSVYSDNIKSLALSDHYDGKVFRNNPSTKTKSFFDLLRWRFNSVTPIEEPSRVPKVSAKPASINPERQIALTFVGHSTFLLQARGLNILTDPIWSKRCSPISFLGPARLQDPGITFDDLPKIDMVLLSHNHYDHMDLPTLKSLWLRDKPLFVVPLKNKATLSREGIGNTIELDWWESTTAKNKITITAVPAQHWSGRWILDRNDALWAGFVISFGDKRVFFTGDSGFGPHFAKIKEKFVSFDVALLPIGAYLPRWFMKDHHLSPGDAIRVADILGARKNVPMHFGTFSLGDDGFTKARSQLEQLILERGKNDFLILEAGEGWIEQAEAK